MISRLSIQGLAIIDSLSIDFSSGFNVITGETGAGKSILIRGLNYLLGAKASADAVRQGCEQASIAGEFVVPKGHPALQILTGLGIDAEAAEDGYSILVRRQITAKGRSQSWVNDVVVTSTPLKELGGSLVDIFGQHENQRLMEEPRHVFYLDKFVPDKNARTRVETRAREAAERVSELRRLVDEFRETCRDQDYVNFRLKAVTEFDPSEEEFAKLQHFCKGADHIVHVREKLSQAIACLDGVAGEGGVATRLREGAKLMSTMGDDADIASLKERLLATAAEAEDVSYELGKRASQLDVSDEDLEAAHTRLFGYQDLLRKHAVTDVPALIAQRQKLEAAAALLESAVDRVGDVLEKCETALKALEKETEALSTARKKAAKAAKLRVESELHDLAMPGSVFDVSFAPVHRAIEEIDVASVAPELAARWGKLKERLSEVSEIGAERCQFLLASNPGEPIHPLTRIASGGELSRIMLALKKALAADAETCVLVFDEIDAGISGRVADVVGKKMRELASSFQIICISHLPQVAVYADSHLLVKKLGKDKRTESTIVRLSAEESAREIARLLSGSEVSKPSLDNAKNLIAKARGKQPTRSGARA